MRPLYPLLFFILAVGCGLLEPRKSAPPSDFSGRDFTQYSDLLLELEDIYTLGKSSSLPNLLADSGFLFDGDTLDSATVHPAARTWGRNEEIRVTDRILADTLQRISPALFEYVEKLLYGTSDSVVVQWVYQLTRRDSVLIQGRSEFTLIRLASRFYVIQWKDRSTGEKSWGRWKMENL